jgi:hypothetical protein
MTLGVGLNLAALVAVAAYLVRLAYPGSEAVRIRNALLLEPGTDDDFSWTPDRVPAGFRLERGDPRPEFGEAVRALGVDRLADDWSKARHLAGHLTEHASDDETGAVGSDLPTTYRRIREGYGYCADYVKVYLALAHAAGLTARQWAFSFDGFGGHGHTFLEVFDRQRGKWLFLDVFNNFHAVAGPAGEPLSALELREVLRERPADLRFEPNGPGRPGFVIPEKGLDYYRRGLREWYLLWGNAVSAPTRSRLVNRVAGLGGGLGRIMAMLLGVQPRIRILRTGDNQAQVAALAGLRRRLAVAVAALAALAIGLAVQLALVRSPA